MNKTIIHISGSMGSGKSFIGNKLKKEFKNKIVVKDIDELLVEFEKEYYCGKKFKIINKEKLQKYINNFITKHSLKHIIFVGLNNCPWWHKNYYYNMHSTYNYFIDLDDETILKQKCKRILLEMSNYEYGMNDLISNNKKYIKNASSLIATECNLKKNNKVE